MQGSNETEVQAYCKEGACSVWKCKKKNGTAEVLLVSRRRSNHHHHHHHLFILVPVVLDVCLFAFCLYVKYIRSYILKFYFIYIYISFPFLIRLILPHFSHDPLKCASSPFVSWISFRQLQFLFWFCLIDTGRISRNQTLLKINN